MAYIGNIPAEKFTSVDIQNFTVSATANYTLDRPVANENEIELFINNVRQHPGSGKAYTASGTALTLSEATLVQIQCIVFIRQGKTNSYSGNFKCNKRYVSW